MATDRIDDRLAWLYERANAGDTYTVLAFRYGTCIATRAQYFRGYERDRRGDAPLRLDYFLWVICNDERTIVVDTGFHPSVAQRRRRNTLVAPRDALALAGIEAATVGELLVTHLHYDHIGNLDAFTRASIYIHRRELEYWRGPEARRGQWAELVEASELAAVESADRRGRLTPVDDDFEIVPGVFALWTGGHTPGQLIVVVRTARSLVVVASDALHFYEELEPGRQFVIVSDRKEMDAGYDFLRRLAAHGAVIVPGHDPLVFDRFQRLDGELADLAVRVG